MAKGSETFCIPYEVESALSGMGAMLERARLARGDTQKLVGERCALHPQTIARIERGDPSVAIGKYFAVMHLYGLSGRLFELAKTDEATEILYRRRLPRRGSRSPSAQND